MPDPDWQAAEELLLERSQAIIRQFAQEHPGEVFSIFAYSVDSMYTGVGINFDTLTNSLRKAKAKQRYEINYRNQILASDRGWQDAQYLLKGRTREIDDFNRDGPWKYPVVAFVELVAWEQFFNRPGWDANAIDSDILAKELDGRISATLWRVVDRLLENHAFDGLQRAAPFHVLMGFHDEPMIVMRIVDWPIVQEGT
jgi:hypothetical protein